MDSYRLLLWVCVCVCVRVYVCVCVCLPHNPDMAQRRRGGEFDICKLNSAQTWQWWSVVHSSRDCLYLHSCPWVLQQACPLHRPQPRRQPAHLLMTVLKNQIHTRYMFYQLELAGEREARCLCVSILLTACFSLLLFLIVRSGVLSLQASF